MISRHLIGNFFVIGGVEVTCVVKYRCTFNQTESCNRFLTQNLLRPPGVVNNNTFLLCPCNLPLMGGHFFSFLQAKKVYICSSHPLGRKSYINGHIAAANHDHISAKIKCFTKTNVSQKIPAPQDALLFRTIQRDPGAPVGTTCDKNRIKILLELVHGDIFSNGGISLKSHTPLQDIVDVLIQPLFRQSIVGDTISHHAARFWKGIKNSYLMPFSCKVVGSREPCRAGPHNSHLLAGLIGELFFLLPCIAALVHSSSLNGPNSNGFSKLLVCTYLFAWGKTGVCTYSGKR